MKKLIALLALAVLVVPAVAAAQTSRATSGTVYASVTHTEGRDLYVSGDLKDRVLGRGAIVYITNVRPAGDGAIEVVARKITIYLPGGSLTGTGKATQSGAGDATKVSDGTFTLTKGTGSMKGRRMSGTFTGTQTNGVYKFAYRGTLR